MKHPFIALSGIDGAGKSTQLSLIKKHFESQNKRAVCLWSRGGSTSGAIAIKFVLRKLAGNRLPASGHSARRDEMLSRGWVQRLWLTLAILDLIRIYGIIIRFHRLLGRPVLCDRYLWDTLIDFKIMFPAASVEETILWRVLVWCAPVPTRSVLLMIPLHLSEERCSQKYDPFPDTHETRKLRFQLYESTSKYKYWDVIDSTQTANKVLQEILENDLS